MSLSSRRLLTTLGAAALLLSGCSSDSGTDAAAPTSSGSPSSSPASAPTTAVPTSGDQVLRDAAAAVRSAESVHVIGTFTENGSPIKVNLKVSRNGEMSGSMSTPDTGEFQLIRTLDATYIGGKEFLRKSAGEAAAKVIGDRWLKSTGSDASSITSALQGFTLDGIADSMILPAAAAAGDPSVSSTTEPVNGHVGRKLSAGDGFFYVAAEGKAYPLQLNSTKDPVGVLDFTEYDVPLNIEAPKNVFKTP